MSLIDLCDLISDPDIAGQTFTVVRRQAVVDDRGEEQITTIVVPNVVGQVSPTGDNSLVRQAAFESQGETAQVITQYRLRGATREPSTGLIYKPDIVLWQGNHYQVVTVNSYDQYGRGFIVAECEATDYQVAPDPVTAPQVGRADFSQPQQSGIAAVLADSDPPREGA